MHDPIHSSLVTIHALSERQLLRVTTKYTQVTTRPAAAVGSTSAANVASASNNTGSSSATSASNLQAMVGSPNTSSIKQFFSNLTTPSNDFNSIVYDFGIPREFKSTSLSLPVSTLQELPSYTTPLAKLDCLRLVIEQIRRTIVATQSAATAAAGGGASPSSNSSESGTSSTAAASTTAAAAPNTDLVLKLLCWVIILANSPELQLFAHLHFIQLHTTNEIVFSELGFYLTAFQSCVQYLSQIDVKEIGKGRKRVASPVASASASKSLPLTESGSSPALAAGESPAIQVEEEIGNLHAYMWGCSPASIEPVPVLVESLEDKDPVAVHCGEKHTLALTRACLGVLDRT